MSVISIIWDDFSQEDWENLLLTMPRSNVFQDWDFGDAIKKEKNTSISRAIILNGSKKIGLFQIFTIRHFGLFKQHKIIRGPLFNEPPLPMELDQIITAIKKHFSILKGNIFSIAPELPDTDSVSHVLKQVGLNKIMTGYESIWLDLRQPQDKLRGNLHSKWRNQLSKSESENLRIYQNQPEDLNWLIDQNRIFQTNKGFSSLPSSIFLKIPKHKIRILSAHHKNKICAAMLFQVHGTAATYQIGYISPEGKPLNAGNFLLWNSLINLKHNHVKQLDLGGIDRDKAPDLARFKERLGGEEFTLTGSYI